MKNVIDSDGILMTLLFTHFNGGISIQKGSNSSDNRIEWSDLC